MSGTCKTCRHWHAPSKDDDKRFGFCEGTKQAGGYPDDGPLHAKMCLGDQDPESVLDDTCAYTQDASNYCSTLMTGPDFGCIKWEAA